MKTTTPHLNFAPTVKILLAASLLLTVNLAKAQARYENGFQKICKTQLKKKAGLLARHRNNVASLPGSSMNYNPDFSGGWEYFSNSTYTYNPAGNLTERVDTEPVTNQNITRQTSAYNWEGLQTESMEYEWMNNAWELYSGFKAEFTYNSNNKLTDQIYLYYYNSSGSFQNSFRMTTAYNMAGNMESDTYYYWNDSVWALGGRDSYTYNAANEISEILSEEFDDSSNVFYNSHKYTHIVWHNFSQFLPESYIGHGWDGTNWQTEDRGFHTYDQYGGSVALWEFYDDGVWETVYRDTEVYDTQYNFTGYLSEAWTGMDWDLDFQREEALTYNANFDITERIYRHTFFGPLEDNRREVYSNFITVSATKPIKPQLDITIYPNPANQFMFVKNPENKPANLRVTDLTGRVVITRDLALTEEQINVAHLPAGTYLMHITGKENSKTVNIVKQ